MAKILLVEDDNNLREIYQARLQAEGYQIVAARDGEEALVVAKSEKPDLIISDIMMPKISGFEMLDILRSTDSLKNVKVIMLTALGQNDDQQRANKLGADRYLVKSQVTLEDIIKVSHELLGDSSAQSSAVTSQTDPTGIPPPTPTLVDPPVDPIPVTSPPVVENNPAPVDPIVPVVPPPASLPPTPPPQPVVQPVDPPSSTANDQVEEFTVGADDKPVTSSAVMPDPAVPLPGSPPGADQANANLAHDDGLIDSAVKQLGGSQMPAPADSQPPTEDIDTVASPSSDANQPNSTFTHNKVIQPLRSQPKPDIESLVAEEEAKGTPLTTPSIQAMPKQPGEEPPSAGSVSNAL